MSLQNVTLHDPDLASASSGSNSPRHRSSPSPSSSTEALPVSSRPHTSSHTQHRSPSSSPSHSPIITPLKRPQSPSYRMSDAAPSTASRLTRAGVASAHAMIKPYIHQTDVIASETLSRIASTLQDQRDPASQSSTARPYNAGPTATFANPQIRVHLKLESQQLGGAFKARGAFHFLSRVAASGSLAAASTAGVITHSSGNHAQALALAARTFGVPAHIVMPSISTASKIAATQAYGAHVYFSGSTEPERTAVVQQVQRALREQHGVEALLVPPYDHEDIVLGQGTVGLEFEQQVKEALAQERLRDRLAEGWGWRLRADRRRRRREREARQSAGAGAGDGDADAGDAVLEAEVSEGLDAVVAPCGGGGLLSGVATACAGTGIRVYGSEPSFEGADDCSRGLRMTPPTRIEKVASLTIADGVRTPVGVIPWSVISDTSKVRGVFAVTEEEIKKAMRLAMERAKCWVEPSGVVALAVVLFNEEFRSEIERLQGGPGAEPWRVGVVVSGGNTTIEAVSKIFADMDGVNGVTDHEREQGTKGLDGGRTAENVAG